MLLSGSLVKVNKPNKYILVSYKATSINLFCSWRTIIRNKLIRISLFFMNVCQLRNKFMLMWNKNIFIPNVRICQTTWQQHKFPIRLFITEFSNTILKCQNILPFWWLWGTKTLAQSIQIRDSTAWKSYGILELLLSWDCQYIMVENGQGGHS